MNDTLFSSVKRLIASLLAAFRRPPRRQVAALVWRRQTSGEVEILTITTRRSKRWSIPKGWPIKGKTFAEAAAQEAWEEAGVRGRISAEPLGAFPYLKAPKKAGPPTRIVVEVFPLMLEEMVNDYPEAGQRSRTWRSQTEAAHIVMEPDLKAIIRAFRP